MPTEPNPAQLKMDAANLYREELITDRRIGTIRVLTPVKTEGVIDPSRRVLYVGEAQMLTPAGPLPIAFEIEARSLAEAVDKFATEAQLAVERTVRELQELRREAASSIVVPDRPIPGLSGRGGPRGGGLIQPP
jgi:hypothetical protein